ncbi:unnamed protein product [Lampetra fluviatilis]
MKCRAEAYVFVPACASVELHPRRQPYDGGVVTGSSACARDIRRHRMSSEAMRAAVDRALAARRGRGGEGGTGVGTDKSRRRARLIGRGNIRKRFLAVVVENPSLRVFAPRVRARS